MPLVNLSQLEQKVWDRMEQNNIFYPQSDVDDRINEGVRISNLFGGWNQGKMNMGPTVANQVIYTTPATMLLPTKMYVAGQEVQKDLLSNITATRRKWYLGAGTKIQYWMPLGINTVAVFPTDKAGSLPMQVWGVIEPNTLVNGNDTANIPDEYQDLIIEYAFINLSIKEGGAIFTSAAKQYNPWLKKMAVLQRWRTRINPRFVVEVKQPA